MYLSDHIKVLLAVTGIISIAGGLTAIMYIDALQAVIMVIGAFTLCLQCFSAANISSLSQFKQAYLNSTYDYHQLTGKFQFSQKRLISRLNGLSGPGISTQTGRLFSSESNSFKNLIKIEFSISKFH